MMIYPPVRREMQLLDRTFFVYAPIDSSHVSVEALQRILGITPAFMRPRMSLPILSDVVTNSLLQLMATTTISFVKKLPLEDKRSLYGISSAFRPFRDSDSDQSQFSRFGRCYPATEQQAV